LCDGGGNRCNKARDIEKQVTCNRCGTQGRAVQRSRFLCVGCNKPVQFRKRCSCGLTNSNQQFWNECGECQSRDLTFVNCSTCPLNKLSAQWATETGQTLRTISALESSIQRYKFSPEDITHKEDMLLRILDEERSKWRIEQMPKS